MVRRGAGRSAPLQGALSAPQGRAKQRRGPFDLVARLQGAPTPS